MSVDQDALDILCEVFDDRIEDVMSNRDNLSYTLYDDDGYPVGAAIFDEFKSGDRVRYVYVYWIGGALPWCRYWRTNTSHLAPAVP